MIVALVRVRECNEFVGIFWARNLFELLEAVDECCDPAGCEFASLTRPSGLYVSGAAPPVPHVGPNPDDDTETDGFEEKFFKPVAASLECGELLLDALCGRYGEVHLRWKPLIESVSMADLYR